MPMIGPGGANPRGNHHSSHFFYACPISPTNHYWEGVGVGGYEDERGDWLEVIAAQEELTK